MELSQSMLSDLYLFIFIHITDYDLEWVNFLSFECQLLLDSLFSGSNEHLKKYVFKFLKPGSNYQQFEKFWL